MCAHVSRQETGTVRQKPKTGLLHVAVRSTQEIDAGTQTLLSFHFRIYME